MSAFRFCRCVGSLQGLWYGWVNCAFQVTSSSVQQRLFFQVPAFNHFSLHFTAPHLCFFVPHTGVHNSRNRFRMSSTGEEHSKYPAEDPRGARAVSKLSVVGFERDSSSSPPLAQQVLHQHCELLQASWKVNILTAKGRSHAGDAELRASRKVFRIVDIPITVLFKQPLPIQLIFRAHRT